MVTNELDKLRNMLSNAGIPFESIREEYPDGFWGDVPYKPAIDLYGDAAKFRRNQIIYRGHIPEIRAEIGDWWKFDAIWQYGSYGARKGMIETYGELGVDEHGDPQVMDAEKAFEIIKKDWEENANV